MNTGARWHAWLVLAVLFLVWWRWVRYPGEAVTVHELKNLLDQNPPATATLLLDVREPDEFAAGRVPGARNLPLSQVAGKAPDLAGFATILAICQWGGRSAAACRTLAALLPKARVINVTGGMVAWQASGFPLER